MDLRHAVTILPDNHFRLQYDESKWEKEGRRIDLLIGLINRGRYQKRQENNAALEFFMYLNGLITGLLLGYLIFAWR